MNFSQIIEQLLDDGGQDAAVAEVCAAAAAAGAACVVGGTNVDMDGWAGRVPGSLGNIKMSDCPWISQYLSTAPFYSARHFRARFRVSLSLFRV